MQTESLPECCVSLCIYCRASCCSCKILHPTDVDAPENSACVCARSFATYAVTSCGSISTTVTAFLHGHSLSWPLQMPATRIPIMRRILEARGRLSKKTRLDQCCGLCELLRESSDSLHCHSWRQPLHLRSFAFREGCSSSVASGISLRLRELPREHRDTASKSSPKLLGRETLRLNSVALHALLEQAHHLATRHLVSRHM